MLFTFLPVSFGVGDTEVLFDCVKEFLSELLFEGRILPILIGLLGNIVSIFDLIFLSSLEVFEEALQCSWFPSATSETKKFTAFWLLLILVHLILLVFRTSCCCSSLRLLFLWFGINCLSFSW